MKGEERITHFQMYAACHCRRPLTNLGDSIRDARGWHCALALWFVLPQKIEPPFPELLDHLVAGGARRGGQGNTAEQQASSSSAGQHGRHISPSRRTPPLGNSR